MKPEHKTNWLRAIQEAVDRLESLILDLVSATTPWLAPVVPAWLTYQHTLTVLLFPPWLAGAAALAVEFLGLSTIHTSLQFWSFNQSRRASDAGAPFWVALCAAGFYLAIIVVVNIILDNSPLTQRTAKALLSLISVVAGVTLALRGQHKRRLADATARRSEEREERAQKRAQKLGAEVQLKRLEVQLEETRRAAVPAAVPQPANGSSLADYAAFQAVMQTANGDAPKNAEELKKQFGVAHTTAYRWWRRYEESQIAAHN